MDDETLVREAVGGNIPAFTAIFNRYEAQVHDFALALVRDRTLALSIAQATFLEASERLESLQQPDRLIVWLLAITRYQAAQHSDSSAGLDRQPAQTPQRAEGWTDDDAERAQQAGLVWEATADLPLRERALLDLHLRQGLDGEDLADALGVGPTEAAELRAALPWIEKGLAGYLIVRKADRRCPDLPLVLRGWDGRFTPLVASHIAAHVEACRVCRESTAALASPFALYAWAPRAPLPNADAPSPAADTTSAHGAPVPDARPSPEHQTVDEPTVAVTSVPFGQATPTGESAPVAGGAPAVEDTPGPDVEGLPATQSAPDRQDPAPESTPTKKKRLAKKSPPVGQSPIGGPPAPDAPVSGSPPAAEEPPAQQSPPWPQGPPTEQVWAPPDQRPSGPGGTA